MNLPCHPEAEYHGRGTATKFGFEILPSCRSHKGRKALYCQAKSPSTAFCTGYWEIVEDNLSKAGWSWGCVSAIDSEGRTIWIADAHRDDGKRFVVRADEKLTAFVELESAIRAAES
jgi:hypothetical protein